MQGEFIDSASFTLIDVPTSDSAFEIAHFVCPRCNERTNHCACSDSADRAIWHELIQGHQAQSSPTQDSTRCGKSVRVDAETGRLNIGARFQNVPRASRDPLD
jgi:hypothetical protein